MEQTDTPAEAPVSSTTQEEITTLTDKLEEPPTQPIKDVQTFWNRLDSLLVNLEESEINKKSDVFHSFLNQPERVNISSDSDISDTQAQYGTEAESYNNFRVAIKRPFLNVKSIQLLRASIPNAVTNIPNEECVFWYYRFPVKTFNGTISISTPTVYTNATFTTSGVITPASTTSYGLLSISPGFPNAGIVTYYTVSITGLSVGSQVTISGVSPAGYNGTFVISIISIPNVSFSVVNSTTGSATLPSATWTQSITDIIDWSTVPYSLKTSTGTKRGYFAPPTTAGGSQSIYVSSALSGTIIGTITRSAVAGLNGIYMPGPSQPVPPTSPQSLKYLHMVRLLPSYYKAELFSAGINSAQDINLPPTSTYGFNRTFSDYEDLASELAKSCAADPLYASRVAELGVFPTFIPNDISLTFNTTLNKFIFTGNNTLLPDGTIVATYLPAGYLDENLWATVSPEDPYLIPYNAYQLFIESGIDYGDYVYVRGIQGQPYRNYKTLNMRLGFNWNGNVNQIQNLFPINIATITGSQTAATTLTTYLNRLRPVPPYIASAVTAGDGAYTSDQHTADSYADLVHTNTISLYANFVGGSTFDSITNTQLLACVPMNANNLGVTFYNATLYCPLTKISDQIYEIEIRMLTDTGAPYNIPNSAIVSLELALTY